MAEPLPLMRSRSRRAEQAGRALFVGCAAVSVLVSVGIVAVLAVETIRFFGSVSVVDFLTGATWAPVGSDGEGSFGVLPLLAGTAMIAVGSIVVGLPLGLATAVYLAEYASPRVRGVLKPAIELLAGVPTVVIGFFALQFITPVLLRPLFGTDRVFIFNAAAGAIAVGLMVTPLIASISEDAIRSVPSALREAALGLGASRRVSALRVILPAALSGIAASVILATSRAVGETMAVTIAAGSTPVLTTDFFSSIQTLTAYIAQTVGGEAAAGTVRYQSLFAVGSTLFAITLAMNMASNRIVRRFRQVYQ
jgi:phosphate transport system permease protein